MAYISMVFIQEIEWKQVVLWLNGNLEIELNKANCH